MMKLKTENLGSAEIREDKPRSDTLGKVTGKTAYTEDLPSPHGMVYGAMLCSPHAHARIRSIDTSKTCRLPGVLGVLDRDHLDGVHPVRELPRNLWKLPDDQPFLAIDKVRFEGEIVAAVAAEDLRTARMAAQTIEVEYEILPPLFDPAKALDLDAPILHESKGTNLVLEDHLSWGDVEQGFKEADVVFEDTYTSPFMFHHPMEPVGVGIAQFANDEMTIWTPTSSPFVNGQEVAKFFGLDPDQVRIRVPPIGGHFGSKAITNSMLAALILSRKTGRPVKLVPTISESFRMNARHAMIYRAKVGVKRDGTLTALDVQLLSDTGAYTTAAQIATHNMVVGSRGAYRIPHLRVHARCVYTNKVPAGHTRATGQVQSTWGVECVMDDAARRLGMDPLDFKKKNVLHRSELVAENTLPLDTDYFELIDKAIGAIQWDGRPQAKSKIGVLTARSRRLVRGKGASVSLRPGGGVTGGDRTYAMVTMDTSGKVKVQHNAPDPGQGTHNLFGIIVSKALGIPQSDVQVSPADTVWKLPFSGVIAQQTTVQMGNAVKNACDNLTREVIGVACQAKGGSPKEWRLIDGRLCRAEASFSFSDVLQPMGEAGSIKSIGFYSPPPRKGKSPYGGVTHWSPGAAAAEVEVDRETGEFRVLQFAVVVDAGRALHYRSAQSQMLGGAVMGVGHALFEEEIYEEGQLLNGDPFQYRLPLMVDIPPAFHALMVENGDGPGPFGSKGMSQTSIVTVAPAIANAICDALGVRVRSLPITPEKILHAMGKLNPAVPNTK
jgi:CO/xanthine dehydrogenase Mo-binding subunit